MAATLVLLLFFSFSITAFADEEDHRLSLLNNLELSPTSVSSPELDLYLDELLAEITTDDMDTFTKLQVSFDYIIENTSYSSHIRQMGNTLHGVTLRNIYNTHGEIEGYGATALVTGKGLCNAYSAAWILMAQKLGVEATLARGYTRRAGGGYTYHEWAEVDIDGVLYSVDPQLQQSLRKYGGDPYSVFFTRYENQVGRYKKI